MIPVVVIALIAIVGGGIFMSQNMNNSTTGGDTMEPTMAVQTSPAPRAMEETTGMEESMGMYKNGSYESNGAYTSPGGAEQVGVKLTLKDDVITEVEFMQMAERPASVRFQKQFAEGYKDMVVGKKIDEVQLTKVSGSSLTPKGFMDALQKIKDQAAKS